MPKLRPCSGLFCMVVIAVFFARGLAASAPPDWKAEAAKEGLTPEEITRLEMDKVLVSRREKPQSFSAYFGPCPTLFITTDALLNAYHVLFEETLRRREEVNAGILRDLCAELGTSLPSMKTLYAGDKTTIDAALSHAEFVVGVALKLLGSELDNPPESLRRAIDNEFAAIIKAQGEHKPAPFGAPEPNFIALDYTLFRPVGIYDTTESLKRYFRAVRWLQLAPFRVENHKEWLALHMLSKCEAWEAPGPKHAIALRDLWYSYARNTEDLQGHATQWVLSGFRGPEDGNLPIQVNEALFQTVAAAAKELVSNNPDYVPTSPDRIQQWPKDGWHLEYRVLPSLMLPEQKALELANQANSSSGPSGGLEFNAWLGLPLGENLLSRRGDGARLSVLTMHRPVDEAFPSVGSGTKTAWWQNYQADLPLEYRAALRMLGEVDPRAPAFMKQKPWQLKTLQTISASWAQDRHAWALQAKPEVHFLGATPQPAGFIEPASQFYLCLSSLAGRMSSAAADIESCADPVAPVIEEALALAKEQRRIASGKMSREDAFEADWDADQFTQKYGVYDDETDKAIREAYAEMHKPQDGNPAPIKPPTAEVLRANAGRFEKFAAQLPTDARPGTYLWRRIQRSGLHTDQLWRQLEALCTKLAMLAEKQLEGRDFTPEENAFVSNLGHQLSEIMLYRGQAAIHPPDDAPRIARISSDPRTGQIFHAAIGRPRLLFVLYPWKNREVFCQGVIMPYHEITSPSSITDSEWQEQIRGDKRPAVPDWLKNIVPAEAKLDDQKH